jgi:hypothetical protein
MPITRLTTLLVAVVCAALLLPSAGQAAGRTKTLKVFSKTVGLTLTHADGTVVSHPPFPTVQPGDTLDVYSLDFRGNHKRHAKRFLGSEHLRCVFGTGEPDCVSHVALGRSLLIWEGDKLVTALGRYRGATGHVVSNKEVPGGNDIVAKIKLPRR